MLFVSCVLYTVIVVKELAYNIPTNIMNFGVILFIVVPKQSTLSIDIREES